MVVFDTSVAAIAFDQNAAIPLDPATNKPVSRCRERLDILLQALEQKRERILLPTPTIAEYIVGAGPDREERLNVIVNNKTFVVAPFDLKAAVECALIEDGSKGKQLSPEETKAKIKFDRQIIAIAKSRGARAIYTGDVKLGNKAKDCGLEVVFTWELPMPPPVQLKLVEQDAPAAAPEHEEATPAKPNTGAAAPAAAQNSTIATQSLAAANEPAAEVSHEHKAASEEQQPAAPLADGLPGRADPVRPSATQTGEQQAAAQAPSEGASKAPR